MPFTARSGARIHYIVDGSGPPLLLGHGFTGSIDMWLTAPFYEDLRRRFTVIPLMPGATVRAISRMTPALIPSGTGWTMR